MASARREQRQRAEVRLVSHLGGPFCSRCNVTTQTLEMSAAFQLVSCSSVDSVGESGCGSRMSLDFVHVLAIVVDVLPQAPLVFCA